MVEESTNQGILSHHVPEEFCRSRAAYRQGRKLTAVKVPSEVYTVSKESTHLLIFNVPAINLNTELQLLCERFGKVATFEKMPKGLEFEKFTDVYHVNYSKIPCARRAKKMLDNRSFYGGFLHVCYAPERETLEETRIKLITRRNEIAVHTGRKPWTKSIIPQRFNSINRKRPFTQNSRNFCVTSNNEEPNTNGMDQPSSSSHFPQILKLIPRSVVRKDAILSKEPPKKIPRIIFRKSNCEKNEQSLN